MQIGSHRWIDDGILHSQEDCDDLKNMEIDGSSQINIAVDGILQGSLLAIDTPRDSSRQAIADLKQMGIEQLVMLTGDQPAAAQQIAEAVGVTDFRSGLLPQDKLIAVEDLQRQYGSIVMVGDGSMMPRHWLWRILVLLYRGIKQQRPGHGNRRCDPHAS